MCLHKYCLPLGSSTFSDDVIGQNKESLSNNIFPKPHPHLRVINVIFEGVWNECDILMMLSKAKF